ncbi:MAG TPA: phytanoyl-CoA dioxygenase family protein [Actinophytocola sp.]|jgi:ectoine hydroxylase-related dioxygenase (phytanoyl-CoA dioxygenase family)|uniref:phytanoyl-CoA dioxygenase family protein n=1 Tax=Actinophytocola sp. TaxID=1872138 RepID=UPI002E036F5D|nr:phytanoyl-CoA dioxygenase family protein [Actinophytocola sp.]
MGTAVDTRSTLNRDGLTWEQHRHFSEHGWVLLEGVVEPELCQAIREATERLVGRFTCGRTRDPADRANTTAYRDAHMHDPVFYELYRIPGLLPAARQLIGHDRIRHMQSFSVITYPDRDRHAHPEVVNDRRMWGWHRSFRPKDIIKPHDTDPRLVHTSMLTMGMYFTPVSPEHGVTAILDRSHTYTGPLVEKDEDTWDAVEGRYEIVQPTAEAGSIVMFSESTVHAPAPIYSEQVRFAHFAWMAVPWFHRFGREPYLQDYFADEDLCDLFAPCVMDDNHL